MDIKKSTFKKPDYWVKRKPTNYLFKRKFFPVCRGASGPREKVFFLSLFSIFFRTKISDDNDNYHESNIFEKKL